MANLIGKAVDALKAGKPADAVAPLVAEWRKVRAPALADVIDAVSAAATEAQGPLSGSTRKARMAAWDAALEKAGPGELGVLFDALETFALAEAQPRHTALKEKAGDDPRIVSHLLKLAYKPPNGWQGAASQRFWFGVLAALERLRDARVVEQVPKLLAHWEADRSHTVGRLMVGELPRLQGYTAAWPKPPAFDAAVLEPVKAQLGSAPVAVPRGSATKSASFAAVFADPFDDGRRRVLADALIEKGDVRGELIMLQLLEASGPLTAAQRKRVSQLLKQHARTWLGPLDGVIHKSGLRFARGFPVAAVVGAKSRDRCSEAVGLPEWATFEELDCTPWLGDRAPLVTHEVMRSLKVVHAASVAVFESQRPLPLEEINFPSWLDPKHVAIVFDAQCVPKLKRLSIWPYGHGDTTDAAVWKPFWGSRVMAQLEELTVNSPNKSVTEWFALVAEVPANVKRVSVSATSSAPWAVRFTRSERGWDVALRYGWNSQLSEAYLSGLDEYLKPVQAKFERVTFDFNRAKAPPTDAFRERVTATLRRRLGAGTVELIEPGKRARAGRA